MPRVIENEIEIDDKMLNDYIQKLYYYDFGVNQINIMSKIYKEFSLDLSELDNDVDIDWLRKLKENYGQGNRHYRELIENCIKDGVDCTMIYYKNFWDINENSKKYLYLKILGHELEREQLKPFCEGTNYSSGSMNLFIEAIAKEVDISDYLDPKINPKKLYVFIRGENSGIKLLKYKDFSVEQLENISLILETNLDKNVDDKILEKIINIDYSAYKMLTLYNAFVNKSKYTDELFETNFDDAQLVVINFAITKNLDLKYFMDKSISEEKMLIIFDTLLFVDNSKDYSAAFNNKYDKAQSSFIAYCINDDIDITEFNSPEYNVMDMVQIAKFIKENLPNEYIDLNTFKQLSLKEKAFINRLFTFRIEENIKNIDLKNIDNQTILDNLFDTDNKFIHINKNIDIKENYITEEQIDLDENYFAVATQIESKGLKFDIPIKISPDATDAFDLFLDDNLDNVQEILEKTLYVTYDGSVKICSMTRQDNDGKDYYIQKETLKSSKDYFNYFDSILSIHPYALINMKCVLEETLYELCEVGPNGDAESSPIKNLDDFNKYGFSNYTDNYYFYEVGEYSDMTYVFIKQDELIESLKKEGKTDNLEKIAAERFQKNVQKIADDYNGNVFSIDIINKDTKAVVANFEIIGEYRDFVKNEFQKFILNKNEQER